MQELALEGTPAMDRYGNPTGQIIRQLSAAKSAIELRAKLTGFLIERRENTQKSLHDMNETELRDWVPILVFYQGPQQTTRRIERPDI